MNQLPPIHIESELYELLTDCRDIQQRELNDANEALATAAASVGAKSVNNWKERALKHRQRARFYGEKAARLEAQLEALAEQDARQELDEVAHG